MTETELDRAHGAMSAAPEDDALRLRFYDRLAGAELFLLLEGEAEGDVITPRLFEVEGRQFALAFDRPERLTAFTGQITPSATLSGRALAGMLAGQGIGLGLNLDVAPSAMLLPGEAMAWLAETLADEPEAEQGRVDEIMPPTSAPERLLGALDAKLATAVGLARAAYLVEAGPVGGPRGLMLAFVGAVDGAERALAGAAREALVFSGTDAVTLDVAFLPEGAGMIGLLDRYGLRFDLPEPARPAPLAPGSDPDTPPRLR